MTATSPPPLTTTFSPEAACTTDTWKVEYLSGSNYYTEQPTASDALLWFSLGPTDWSSCFPSGYQTSTDFFYSPGVCPSGYSVASSSVLSIGASTETQATCCPSGYKAQTQDQWPWYNWARCTSSATDPNYVWTYTQEGTTMSQTGVNGINARAVFIKWQSTDFAPQTTSATSTNTGTSTETNSATPTSQNGTGIAAQGGSSKTWVAGPVVGAIVGCAVVVLAAVWYLRRRQDRQASTSNSGFYQPGSGYPGPRPPTDRVQGDQMLELHGSSIRWELPVKDNPYELP